MFDHRYYQYMKCIAECQSFSKAAEKLYISQSFLSHFVKNVEDEFGISIEMSEDLKTVADVVALIDEAK